MLRKEVQSFLRAAEKVAISAQFIELTTSEHEAVSSVVRTLDKEIDPVPAWHAGNRPPRHSSDAKSH